MDTESVGQRVVLRTDRRPDDATLVDDFTPDLVDVGGAVAFRPAADPPREIHGGLGFINYGTLRLDEPSAARVGDTVVYAFRAQVFVSRCFVAVVSGIGADPVVEGVFTSTGFELDDKLLPVGPRKGERIAP